MKLWKLLTTALLFAPTLTFAALENITWKGTYHDGVPINKNVSAKYCKEHTPGSFIHVVKKTY